MIQVLGQLLGLVCKVLTCDV